MIRSGEFAELSHYPGLIVRELRCSPSFEGVPVGSCFSRATDRSLINLRENSKQRLVCINSRNTLNIAQQFVGNRTGLLGNDVDVDLLAPAFDGAADTCLGQIGEIDG